MIQVRFEKDGKNIILTVQGHSEQAQMGKDSVCSAASILAYTVAQTGYDLLAHTYPEYVRVIKFGEA